MNRIDNKVTWSGRDEAFAAEMREIFGLPRLSDFVFISPPSPCERFVAVGVGGGRSQLTLLAQLTAPFTITPFYPSHDNDPGDFLVKSKTFDADRVEDLLSELVLRRVPARADA